MLLFKYQNYGVFKMKTIYLIGGTMGVGKTTVCQQLKQDLPNSVFLDGDCCWDSSPFQTTNETKTMVIDNICYLLNNFVQCSAYENIIFCWVMHKQFIINSIINHLNTDNCKVYCISLIADEHNLSNRLKADVLNNIRNADIIEKSISKIPLYNTLNTIKIDTNNKQIQTIVNEIKEL